MSYATAVVGISSLKNTKLGQLILVFSGSILIALAAQVVIPFFPVPFTLQTFAVLFVGALFGPKLGSRSVILYLLEGICGLPVFNNFSCGLLIMFGPTGGYLMGFIGGAYLTGYLIQNGFSRNRILIFVAALLGDSVLFTCGYLMLVRLIGSHNAYLLGVVPFYLGELIKLSLVALIVPLFLHKTKTSS